MPGSELIPLILTAPLLLYAGYSDLRRMRIPNFLSLAALVLFVLTAPMVGWSELALRALAGLIVVVLGFLAFARGLLGGGDVKLAAALMLFIPSQTVSLFALGFSLSLAVGIAFLLVARQVPAHRSSDWVGLTETGKFPMGISIALAGLIHPISIWAVN